jgi:uncharacterized membrane protein YfcA
VDVPRLFLLGAAAALAAAVNSVAGGGSLISFPALLAAGVPPVIASATNTAALTPGGVASAFAYRSELGPRARLALGLAACAALGGALGGVLLLSSPPRVFELVVPWLVAFATLTLVAQGRVTKSPAGAAPVRATRARLVVVGVGLAVVAVYGGYFGAGIGMLTLALLALLGPLDVHQLNAIKTVVVAGINGAATTYFLARGRVELELSLVMAVGAVVGGYAGAALARRVAPRRVRSLVIAIGVGLTLLLAARYYR